VLIASYIKKLKNKFHYFNFLLPDREEHRRSPIFIPSSMPEKLLKNRYLIEDLDRDQLGQGAFGHTYLAKDKEYRTDQKVVVKHLQPDFGQCRSGSEQQKLLQIAQDFFLREAKILEKLGRVSSQIPSLLDSFTENNEFYIVQEWINGEPLSKILSAGNRLTQKATIQLLIEILEPLDFCHQEGAIHRDLKPDNIMRRSNDGKLIIIDFGAVREIRQLTLLANEPEQTGSRIGTPGYMPLEQTRGFPVLASDVYAVGAIGIQAMTGKYPHTIELDADGIPKWRQEPNCYATAEFAAVLNQMLAVLPSGRYRDAAMALKALQALKNNQLNQHLVQIGQSAPTSQSSAPTNPPPIKTNQQIAATTALSPAPNTTQPQRGWVSQLSQERFTFESAQLEKVMLQKIEPSKKAKWLRLGQPEANLGKNLTEWQIRKTAGRAEGFTEDLGNGISLEMVYIPPGQFMMGSPQMIGQDTEKPQHIVDIPGFYLGRYVVTQAQYLMLITGNPGQWINAKLPIDKVSWHNAQLFCQKLSAKVGKIYRLPSEAEWEYACRAQTTSPFSCGETITTDLANFDGNFNYSDEPKGQYRERPMPVGSFPPNKFGLHDMHGNVWEWCADNWHENYLGAPQNGSSWNDNNETRVLRGGSWNNIPKNCRSASRNSLSVNNQSNSVGFRIACEADSENFSLL
jgi:eukaryotic-like serine/threonine-protein kinase